MTLAVFVGVLCTHIYNDVSEIATKKLLQPKPVVIITKTTRFMV